MHKEAYTSLQIFEKIRKYWLDKLSGELGCVKLPTDFPGGKNYKPTKQRIVFNENIAGNLIRISKNNDLSLFIFLLTGLKIFISKLTGENDFIITSPTKGSDVDKYNRFVAFRDVVYPEMTSRDLLIEVKKTVIDGFKNQYYPIEKLLDSMDIENNTSIFSIILLLENLHKKESVGTVPRGFENDIAFCIRKDAQEVSGDIIYNGSLFSPDTLKQWFESYCQILAQIIENIDIRLMDIELMGPKERDQVLFVFNNTTAEYPRHKMLHELFIQQAVRTPGRVALVAADKSGFITYRQLNRQTDQLSLLLREKGITESTPGKACAPAAFGPIIPMLLEPSTHIPIGILGILKAGAAYLPIDPQSPEDRINYMLADSTARLLVTTSTLAKEVEKQQSWTGEKLFMDTIDSHAYHTPPLSSTLSKSNPDNLAYIIYTSGTTGRPKGVLVQHRSVVNMLWCRKNQYEMELSDVPLQLFSYSFDGFVTAFFTPLISGARVVTLREEWMTDVTKICETVVHHNVTHFISVPALYQAILENISKKEMASLKVVTLAGDKLSTNILEITTQKNPNLEIINEYGVTEVSVMSTIYRHQEREKQIKIGKPIWNTRFYVVDNHLKVLPIGVPGELWIAGTGVARGYLNKPELTAEKFCLHQPGGSFCKNRPLDPHKNFLLKGLDKDHIQSCNLASMHPCNHATKQLSPHHSPQYHITPFPHSPIYQTGDLARWLPDGNIEFLGRIDQQVKIRGYRIELGEIESLLLKHEKIKEAVVIDREMGDGDKSLCAYIVAGSKEQEAGIVGDIPDTTTLWDYLTEILPGYMIPLYFVPLAKIPLTPNGKIDRKALPDPGDTVAGGDTYTAPCDSIEKQLVEIWSEVLGIESGKLSINANFFHLGGHSLKATILAAKINKKLDVKVPLAEIFNTPTILRQACYIKNAAKEKYASLEPIEKKEYYALSSAQKRFYIIQQMELNNCSYNMPYSFVVEGKLKKESLEHIFRELINRHESLRTSFEIVNDEPVQRIHDHDQVTFEMEYHDFATEDTENTEGTRGLAPLPIDPAEREAQSAERKEERHAPCAMRCASTIKNFIRPFDLCQAPLLRVGLIRQEENKYILMVDMHHIISDGTSMYLLIKEFISLYVGKELPPLRLQYKDFSQWQGGKTQREAIKQQEEYWLKQFNGEIPVLNLPTDYPRPPFKSSEGLVLKFTLDVEKTRKLNDLALNTETTLYMVLLAIYNIFLSKLSGQEEIIVGTIAAGRRHVDLEQIIGMFVNTLALRNYPAGDKTFIEFLEETREKTLNVFENQDYHFEDLVDQILENRDKSRNPIFDVMFRLQNIEIPSEGTPNTFQLEIPGLRFVPYKYESKTSKLDLSLSCKEVGEELAFSFEYNSKLFKKETIERMAKDFTKVLSDVIRNRYNKIKKIELESKGFTHEKTFRHLEFNI